MRRIIDTSYIILICILACACTVNRENLTADATAGFDLGPLPVASRHAADVTDLNGADYDDAGPGTTIDGTAAVLDATGIDYTWARYAANIPANATLNSVSVTVSAVTTTFWLGVSDYGGHNAWQWVGQFNNSTSFNIPAPNWNYLSPGNFFYWVVVADRDNSVRVESCSIDYTGRLINVPPSGEQTAVSGSCISPSLVTIRNEEQNMDYGAPVIAYIDTGAGGAKLNLAYYTAGSWLLTPIMPEHDFALPALRWLGSEFLLVAYDATAGALIDMRLDQTLGVVSTTTIATSPGLGLVSLSLDVDSSGKIGVAHAYADSTTGEVYFSEYDGAAWATGDAAYAGEQVASVCFRYDPNGLDPWLLFTHGTIDNTSSILIDYHMDEGRLGTEGWTLTPISYADSPLLVDLHFTGEGTAEACFLAAREYSISFPISFTASLIYDIVLAKRGVSSWSNTVLFQGSLTPSYSFPNSFITMVVDDALESNWVDSWRLVYTKMAGSVKFDIPTQTPTDGTLVPSTQGMRNDGGGYLDNAFFTGSAGRSFSWGCISGWKAAVAYIKSEDIDPVALFNGQVNTAGDLLYWSRNEAPPPP